MTSFIHTKAFRNIVDVRFERDHREAAAFSMNWASFTSRLVTPPQSCEVRVIWTYEGKSSFSDLSRDLCVGTSPWVVQESSISQIHI